MAFVSREYLEMYCDMPKITELRRSSHRARKDLDHGRIKKGDMYDEWVGLVDGDFTVDRVPWKEYE